MPASELHELLSRKLAQCGVMFDFLDCVADLKGKEVKRAALNELVECVGSTRGVLIEPVYPDIIRMVSTWHPTSGGGLGGHGDPTDPPRGPCAENKPQTLLFGLKSYSSFPTLPSSLTAARRLASSASWACPTLHFGLHSPKTWRALLPLLQVPYCLDLAQVLPLP